VCGIYGCVRKSGPYPAADLFETARVSSSRGQDACGVAWYDADGAVWVRRVFGPFPANPGLLSGLGESPALVGHARLATTGSAGLEDAQPMIRDGVALVHNGNVPGHLRVAREAGISLLTGCDSELLAAILGLSQGEPGERLREALSVIPDGTPYAVLALAGGVLLAARRGLPLYRTDVPGGTLFGSRRASDSAVLVREGGVEEFRPG
jgi:glutamine phosphoribosylpyrophosphate amidotransferase